jgi:hypothetical protein
VDYNRIYAEFIKDRLAKEPTLVGYAERHHIVPRRMAGSNVKANLIRLTPEDHFFAHLLLAKAHGGLHWASVRIMAAAALGDKALRTHAIGGITRFRRRYGSAQRWANEHLSGDNSPYGDKTVYHWKNIDGREEHGTRAGLAKRHRFRPIMLNPIVSGRSRSVYGWYLADRTKANETGNRRGHRHPMADNALYHFRHKDGHNEFRTRLEMVTRYKLSAGALNQMVAGKTRSCGGWYLPKGHDGLIAHERTTGDRNANADTMVYCFRHADGREERCTRSVLRIKYGLSRGALGMLIQGRTKSCNGWYLPERTPDGVVATACRMGARNNLFNFREYDWRHRDGRTACSTLYDMHRCYGGNRPSWTSVVTGDRYSTQGWTLAERFDAGRFRVYGPKQERRALPPRGRGRTVRWQESKDQLPLELNAT